jgi:hypothetical protein
MSGALISHRVRETAHREAGTKPGVTAVVTVTLRIGLAGSKGFRHLYGVPYAIAQKARTARLPAHLPAVVHPPKDRSASLSEKRRRVLLAREGLTQD